MPGHVLIIDAQTNRRIQLHAGLDTDCYPVELAETQLEGLTRIKEDAPEVVIVANDLPGLKLPQFCRILRSNLSTQLTTVVVAVACENHSARVSALTSGAHDLIEYGADPRELRARLRNFMRLRQTTETIRARTPSEPSHCLAEAPIRYKQKAKVTFIVASDLDIPNRFLADLSKVKSLTAQTITGQQAKRSPDSDTDVFVLFEDGQPADARDILAALCTHPESRHSQVLFVSDSDESVASPLDLGAQDQVTSTVSTAELVLRIHRLADLKHAGDRARKSTLELEGKAYTDALTNLNNRTFAEEYLRKTDRMLADHPKSLALLIADVDHFKLINDNHGHAAGDLILAHIASALKSSVRTGDMLARFGGEEFIVLLPNVGQMEARSVAQRLRRSIADQPVALPDGPIVRSTISVGLASTTQAERKSTKDLRYAADTALYRAKRYGRNRLEVATAADFDARPNQQLAKIAQNIG